MSGRVEAPAHSAAHVPIRSCVGCRRRAPRATLVRLAVVDGRVEVDREGCLGGRGAWVCPDANCLEQALRKGAGPLRRALRAPGVAVDADALAVSIACEAGGARRRGDAENNRRDDTVVTEMTRDDSVV